MSPNPDPTDRNITGTRLVNGIDNPRVSGIVNTMFKTVSGVTYWARGIPRRGIYLFREFPNPRPWIDPWWTQIAGPFAATDDAFRAAA